MFRGTVSNIALVDFMEVSSYVTQEKVSAIPLMPFGDLFKQYKSQTKM